MKVVLLSSEAYEALLTKLDTIEKLMLRQEQKEFIHSISWVDTDEVCKCLNISKRTLQRYRSKGFLSYSLMGSKMYYPFSDIQNFRKNNLKTP